MHHHNKTTMTTHHPIEVTPPDITPYKNGNTGVAYITTFDSGEPGPHVMVNAITHGNEICGAIAVTRLFEMGVRPTRGKLTLSFANIDAYQQWDATKPHANRFVDEDFNRVWAPETLGGTSVSKELLRARAMRPAIDTVDLLLDIHSMHDPHQPLMLSGALDKGIQLSRAIGMPEFIVSDQGHANGTRLRDYAGFGDNASAKTAVLVECGQHWSKASTDVAWQTTWRFLRATHCVDIDLANSQIDSTPQPATKVVRVTDALVASSTNYQFRDGIKGLDIIAKKGDVFAHDDGKPVAAPYDNCVLIMPTLVYVKPGLTVVRIGRLGG
jgi:predicted deacylase